MFENGLNWTGEYFGRGLERWPSGIYSPAIPSSMPRVSNPVAALAPAPAASPIVYRPPQQPLWLTAWRGASGLLGGLMGAISFTMDKTAYAVGDVPSYRITGGPPGAIIAWTSFHNGAETGEYQADYGQRIGSDGTWTDTAVQPFAASDAGVWEKQAVVISSKNAPNDTIETGQFFFTVGDTGAASSGQQPSAGGGLLGSSINLFGIRIPTIAALAIGGIALYAFTRR